MLLFLAVWVNAANMHARGAGADINVKVFLLCCKSLHCVCMSGVQGVLSKTEGYARDVADGSLAGLDVSDLDITDSIAMSFSS